LEQVRRDGGVGLLQVDRLVSTYDDIGVSGRAVENHLAALRDAGAKAVFVVVSFEELRRRARLEALDARIQAMQEPASEMERRVYGAPARVLALAAAESKGNAPPAEELHDGTGELEHSAACGGLRVY
jgi:DNA-binding transcriptional ArsR family regulator